MKRKTLQEIFIKATGLLKNTLKTHIPKRFKVERKMSNYLDGYDSTKLSLKNAKSFVC